VRKKTNQIHGEQTIKRKQKKSSKESQMKVAHTKICEVGTESKEKIGQVVKKGERKKRRIEPDRKPKEKSKIFFWVCSVWFCVFV